MDRLSEIRARCEAAKAQKEKGDSITASCIAWSIVINDIPYLLAEIDRLNTVTAEYTSNSTEITINGRQYVPKDELQALTARAEAAEAERDACKADLKSMADWYRDSVCDDGICGWCKQDADHGLDGDANECAGFYKNDCFEWRGPQAGKGEAE